MNLFPAHISINGQFTSVKEFIRRSHYSAHEKECAIFLEEWYSPGKTITVQTSGSTGAPKSISLDKNFIGQSALRTIQFFNLSANDRILHCLPVKFIAGKLMVVRALLGNLNLYMVDPSTGFTFLEQEKFSFAAMVPHQVQKILDAEPVPGAWLQNIKHLLIGGSAIPHHIENSLQNVATECWSGYAMTETATHIALRKINGEGAGDCYHCLDEITVRLSEEGCLQIYMPGLTEQSLTTTDIAEILNEKTFRILGRADNIIISGGIKYSPEILEKKLEPYICCPFLISSSRHNSLGQQLVLVVEAQQKPELITRLQGICREHLERFEQPRQIIFVSSIPRTENGKPDRINLISQFD